MSEVPPTVTSPAPASGKAGWWRLLLIGSLALNMLFIGGAAARFFLDRDHPGRISGITEMQLVPRKFFGDLDRDRRRELLAVFKGYRGEFGKGRDERRALAVSLADALEATPFDEAKVRTAVQAFTQRSAGLIGRGGDAAIEFIGKLDDQERRHLARRIRERSGSDRGHGDDRKDD